MENYVTVREMYESCREDECALDNKSIAVDGWVKNNRLFGNVGFLTFNDGTCFKNAQLVYTSETDGFDGGRFHLLLRYDSFVNRTVQVQGDV
jgi:aspartyl/asparaginyl-tRNA synthetase